MRSVEVGELPRPPIGCDLRVRATLPVRVMKTLLRSWWPLVLCASIHSMACSESAPSGGGGGGNGQDCSDPNVICDLGPGDGGGGGDGGADMGRDGGTDAGGPDGGGDMGLDMGPPDTGADPRNPNNPNQDIDCDGLSDQEEFSIIYPNGQKTDPQDPDSDDDGIPDGVEVGRTASVDPLCTGFVGDADPGTTTSPVNADSDGDGILDGAEDRNRNGRVDPNELNPRLTDSDGDRIPDRIEDQNLNGVFDPGELNGASRDTDGDGVTDGVEDRNRDGVFDDGETDPRQNDTDGDGLLDGLEDANSNGVWEPTETDPRTTDTDCDGVSDGDEDRNRNGVVDMGETNPRLADSDGDLIPDGVELGVTSEVPGSDCPDGVPVDTDTSTTTAVSLPDTDGDGLPDGVEDANQNGAVDPGETNPNDPDSDGDGLDDGDEVLAGFDPNDPSDPDMAQIPGIRQICGDNNLKVVAFNEGGPTAWTLATETEFLVTDVTVTAGSSVAVSLLDSVTNNTVGFVLRMPIIPSGGATTASGQAEEIDDRVDAGSGAAGFTRVARVSGRSITSHDGYETVVSREFDITEDNGNIRTGQLRNELVQLITGLSASDFTGLTNPQVARRSEFAYMEQVLLRPNEVIVVGALTVRDAFDDRTDNRAILLQDLTNGTALAEYQAPRDKDCDPFLAEGESVADFIFMADISGSTDDDRGRISSAADLIVTELQANNVDFRLAVVPHTENSFRFPNGAGDLRGVGFTTDKNLFSQYLSNTSGTDGCEFGLDAASSAIQKALPRSPAGQVDARKLRDGAALAVVYISDEYAEEITADNGRCSNYVPACDTGIRDLYSSNNNSVCLAEPDSMQQQCINQIVQPYVNQIVDNNGVAFAQVITPAASPTSCTGYGCNGQGRNEPGRGYQEVVNATGGAFYSPCNSNPGMALQAIIDAVAGAASQFKLTGDPISSTLRVGVIRTGMGGNGMVDVVPRDRDDGFDYDAASNSIFFRGFTYRPNEGDIVVVSYRLWEKEESPCGDCAPGKTCDESLGVCVCDPILCMACSANEVCDADCNCACTADCNGNCGAGEVCNVTTCQCECTDDCGGACGEGEVCNTNTCTCECVNCGGACEGSLTECNTDPGICACECPADCGGPDVCTGNTVCNTSLCACDCAADCDETCAGNAVCDPGADCGCVCPNDCGGCAEGATCNQASCACECPAGCDANCQNNEVCEPALGCECVCPADCGGCGPSETCDPDSCRCVPTV